MFFVYVCAIFETQKEDKDYLLENQTCFRTGCNTGQSGITSARDVRRDVQS